jgi:hypothetical protein
VGKADREASLDAFRLRLDQVQQLLRRAQVFLSLRVTEVLDHHLVGPVVAEIVDVLEANPLE